MTELEKLRAENRRLMEALTKIADFSAGWVASSRPSALLAREALAASPETAREVERMRALESIFNKAKVVGFNLMTSSVVLDGTEKSALDQLCEGFIELDRIEKEK